MIDRVADLFAGFYKSDNTMETKLEKVMQFNISSKFFTEIFISFAPLFFDTNKMYSLVYSAFKLPRYFRIFEMDNQIDEITEYFG